MYFKDFWVSILTKSKCIPEEELADMTAGEVVRKRKRRKEQPASAMRRRALQQIIFLEDVSAVKDKTFAELAADFEKVGESDAREIIETGCGP